MKNKFSTTYDDFFLELPPAYNLNDIEIQDEYENQTDQVDRGLSEEQVSQIAVDSLSEVKRLKTTPRTDKNNPISQ